MIGTFIRYRRFASCVALTLTALLCLPPTPASADDRKLLTSGTARPNVLIILDTSGSMANDFSNNYLTAGGMDDPDVSGSNYNDPTQCHNAVGNVVACVNPNPTDTANNPVDAPQAKLSVAKDVLKTFINTVENNNNPTMNLGFAAYYQNYNNGGLDSLGIRGIDLNHGKQWIYSANASDGSWVTPTGWDGKTTRSETITGPPANCDNADPTKPRCVGEPLQFGNVIPWGWRTTFAPNGATFPVAGFNAFLPDATGSVIVKTNDGFFDESGSFDNKVNNAAGLGRVYTSDPTGHRFLAWQVIPKTGNTPFGDDPNDNDPPARPNTCSKQTSDPTFTLHEVAQMCTAGSQVITTTYAHPVTLYHHTKNAYNRYDHTVYFHHIYQHTVAATPTTYTHQSANPYMHLTPTQYHHPLPDMYDHPTPQMYQHYGVRTAYYLQNSTCTNYDYSTDPPTCKNITATCDYSTEITPLVSPCSKLVSDNLAPCTGAINTDNSDPTTVCATIPAGCGAPDTNSANQCGATIVDASCAGVVSTDPTGKCGTDIPGTCTVGPDSNSSNVCNTLCNGVTDTSNFPDPYPVCKVNPGTPAGCTSAWDTNKNNSCNTACGDGTQFNGATPVYNWDLNSFKSCGNACGSTLPASAGYTPDHDSTNTCASAGHDSTAVPSLGGYPYFAGSPPADANGNGVIFATYDYFDQLKANNDGSVVVCGDQFPLSGTLNYTDSGGNAAVGTARTSSGGAIPAPPGAVDGTNSNVCKVITTPNPNSYTCTSVLNLNPGSSRDVVFSYQGQFAATTGSGNSAKPLDFAVDGAAASNTCTGYTPAQMPVDANDTPLAPIPYDSANGGNDAEAVEVDEYIKTFLTTAASRAEYHRSSLKYQCYMNGFTLYKTAQSGPSPNNPMDSWDTIYVKQGNGKKSALNVINGLGAVGGTPTINSMLFAANYFENDVIKRSALDQLKICRKNYIILLTDGLESCYNDPTDSSSQGYAPAVCVPAANPCPAKPSAADTTKPCQITQRLLSDKVATFVVFVGSEANLPNDARYQCTTSDGVTRAQLDALSTQNVDTPVYKHINANSRQELLDALNGIIQQIADDTKSFSTPSGNGESGFSTTGLVGTFQPSSARNALGLVNQQRSIWDGHLTSFPLDDQGFLPEDTTNNYQLDFHQALWDSAASLSHVDPGQTVSPGDPLNTADTQIQYILPPLETLVVKDYTNTQYFTGRKVLFSLDGTVPETAVDLRVPTTIPPNCSPPNDTTPWCRLKNYYEAASTPSDTDQQNYINFVRGARDTVLGTAPDGTDPTSYAFRYLDVNPNPIATSPAHAKSMLGDVFHSEPLIIGPPSDLGMYINNSTYDDSGNRIAPCTSCAAGKHSYQDFFERYQRRRRVAYVGANDTLFHAFDAGVWDRDTTQCAAPATDCYDVGTGAELFSYAPRATMTELPDLLNTPAQQWSVDGSPASGDVFFDGNWHTVVVGGLREGINPDGTAKNGAPLVPSMFALDVTGPDTLTHSGSQGGGPYSVPPGAPDCLNHREMDGSAPSVPAGCLGDAGSALTKTTNFKYLYPTVLWEFKDTTDEDNSDNKSTGKGFPDLGATWSKPAVGRIQVINKATGNPEDHFVAIVGGGFDPLRDSPPVIFSPTSGYSMLLNHSGNYLYMIDIPTGKVLYKIDAGRYDDGTGTYPVRHFGTIPGAVNAVDFNTDGYLDAVYFGDTRGDVWKLDLGIDKTNSIGIYDSAGTCLSSTTLAPSGKTGCRNKMTGWIPHLIFDGKINADGVTTGYTDSTFVPGVNGVAQPIFNRPEVVPSGLKDANGQTIYAVIVGTGDRDDIVSDKTTSGRIYVIGDPGPEKTSATTFPVPRAETKLGTFDAKKVLYKIPAPDSTQVLDSTGADVSGSLATLLDPGYYFILNPGERINTDAVVALSKVTLASFTPGVPSTSDLACGNATGFARIYAFQYQTGQTVHCYGLPGACTPLSPNYNPPDRGFVPPNPRATLVSTASLNIGKTGEVTGQKIGSENQINQPYRSDFGGQGIKKRDWKENP
jgi:hypothetical protein